MRFPGRGTRRAMDSCDVLVVGGGPGGSACAWALRRAGLDVVVVDRARFPRDKVCGGWVTPQVMASLRIDLAEYRRTRTLQAITGFRTGTIGVNGGLFYGADAPFGGYKASGIGRQCGIEGLEIFTETKTMAWPAPVDA